MKKKRVNFPSIITIQDRYSSLSRDWDWFSFVVDGHDMGYPNDAEIKLILQLSSGDMEAHLSFVFIRRYYIQGKGLYGQGKSPQESLKALFNKIELVK